ncbi:MAG TPA: cupin domain-containing protein [Thermoleophilaceae bacterium]|nr:cupin domain-containing protein [Thermoleophilaceae bacterium]
MPVIKVSELPASVIAREFIGEDHGGVDVSVIFVDAPPGRGPSLHKHPYPELILIEEGRGTFVLGEEEHEVEAGELVIIPADTPHAFVNSGHGPLRQIDIHPSARFSTEWLDAG